MNSKPGLIPATSSPVDATWELPLGCVSFVMLEGVDIRDMRRKRSDVLVACHVGNGTKLKALREMHDADERLVLVVPAVCHSQGR
ncbi:MAG: hypothetical protein M9955_19445 [Rhizobiaceae bacterium]|nr:hypothetical protein [Rhizobiaceae bacterium]